MTDATDLTAFVQAAEFLVTQAETLNAQLLKHEYDSDPYRLSLAWLRAQTLPYLERAQRDDATLLDDPTIAPLLTTFSLIVTQAAGFLEHLTEA